jgi:hypothetical protein
VLERARQAAAEDPGVEGVVAVLDQHRAAGEVEESPAGVAELGRADQHLPLDQVPALGVGVDRGASVDERVEEPQRAAQSETLGADLEDQEGPVAGRLDVDRHELGLCQRRVRADRDEVQLETRLPGHRLGRAPRLELQ